MFFNILATFAEFEVDLLRMRTREGMAVARAKGKLRGKTAESAGVARQLGSLDQQCCGGGTHCRYSCSVGPGAHRVDRPSAEPLKRGLVHAQIADSCQCLVAWLVGPIPTWP